MRQRRRRARRRDAAAAAARARVVATPTLRPLRVQRSWNLYGADVTQDLIEGIMAGMTSRRNTVDGKPTSLLDLGYKVHTEE